MTLLYIDGFAHGNVNRHASGSTFTVFNSDGIARGAPQGYYASGPNFIHNITASAEVFTGFRFRASTVTSSTIVSFYGDAGATQHLTIDLTGSGIIELRRGSAFGTLLATGATALSPSAWYYIEVRATIADSGGICQVRINGNTSPEIDFSGDTKNAGTNTTIDQVTLGPSNSAFWFTDWYIANALGTSPQNTWFGDTVVRTLSPSADGDLSQLVGSDGNSVANWQQVDELFPSSSDYNGSLTAGNEDTYALTDLPSTSVTVFGAQVSALMAKSDAGTANGKPILRLSGTDYTSGSKTLSTSYLEFLDLYEKNPATTSNWTGTQINAAQVGMQVA